MNEYASGNALVPQPIIYTRDEHNISRQNIDPDALKILYRLLRHGYKAFLVGGGVRDLLLNKIPKDFDIGTDATPRKVKSLFRNSRIIGRRFKLVHVFFRGNRNIEVSTFRDLSEPAESEGDDAATATLGDDNVYGDEATDALRRDITINGLFYDISNFAVIDYVGGMQDLRNKVIRVIGQPDQRFKEDPVRLLRVVRHAARTGFSIEPACWESLLRNHHLISRSAQVRVYEELKKDLKCGHFSRILELLAESGLLKQLLPDLDDKFGVIYPQEHLLKRALQEIDRLCRSGENISHTVVLVLIVLMSSVSKESGAVEINPGDDIFQLVSDTFTILLVPRKERERIAQLLSAYQILSSHGERKPPITQFSRKPYFEDLVWLTRVLSSGESNDELNAILEEAKKLRVNEQRSFHSRPRRRRRRRGGHNRGHEMTRGVR